MDDQKTPNAANVAELAGALDAHRTAADEQSTIDRLKKAEDGAPTEKKGTPEAAAKGGPGGALLPLRDKQAAPPPPMRGQPVPGQPGLFVEQVELDSTYAIMSEALQNKMAELANARMKLVRDAIVSRNIPVSDDGSTGLKIVGPSRSGGLLVDVIRKQPQEAETTPPADGETPQA